MHASMERIHELSGLLKKKDIAKALNVAQSTVTNWGTRGVSREAAMAAGTLYSVDPRYILEGDYKKVLAEVVAGIGQKQRISDTVYSTTSGKLYSVDPIYAVDVDGNKKKPLAASLEGAAQKQAVSTTGHASTVLPVVEAVSVNKAGVVVLGEIKAWEVKPDTLSMHAFIFEQIGRAMMPHFNVGDFCFVETAIDMKSLRDGDFLVVQHNKDDFAVIKQLITMRHNEWYLASTNKDVPEYCALRPFTDFTVIGRVMSKVTTYNRSRNNHSKRPFMGLPAVR